MKIIFKNEEERDQFFKDFCPLSPSLGLVMSNTCEIERTMFHDECMTCWQNSCLEYEIEEESTAVPYIPVESKLMFEKINSNLDRIVELLTPKPDSEPERSCSTCKRYGTHSALWPYSDCGKAHDYYEAKEELKIEIPRGSKCNTCKHRNNPLGNYCRDCRGYYNYEVG